MTTAELINLFSKQGELHKVTAKQASWLFNVAKTEGLFEGTKDSCQITIGSKTYFFKALKIPAAAYGGYVGSKGYSGNYSVYYKYLVEFDNGVKQYQSSLEELNKLGLKYRLVNK